MRVLITGVTGFVGSHMAEFALAQGAEVFGACRWRSNTENIEPLRSRLHLVEADLRDQSSVQEMLEAAAPDCIFHLAGQSQVMTSWHAPVETLETNIIGQVRLLEAIVGKAPRSGQLPLTLQLPGGARMEIHNLHQAALAADLLRLLAKSC